MSEFNAVLTIEFTPRNGSRRRILFEPTGDGNWIRVTERREGGQWFHEGQQVIDDVEIDATHGHAEAGP
jgi:hypothetical protein